MKKAWFFACCLLATATLTTQAQTTLKENTWKTLAKVTYKKEYDELLGLKVDVPVFGREVKALEGKEVTISGFIIPTDGYKSAKEFVFSAFPYNMCFFCGQAGPETVLEVSAKAPIKYSADRVTIRGILQLNSGDVNKLIYSLQQVQLVN
jgi:hypothetical protein